MWASIKARLFGKGSEPPEGDAPAEKGAPASTAAPARSGAPEEGPYTDSFFGRRIRDATLTEVLDDLEIVLLQSDVALPVVERIRDQMARELAGKKLKMGADAEAAIRGSFEHSVRQLLTKPPFDL